MDIGDDTRHLVQAVDEAGFDRVVLGAENPVLVDFTAAWCGPCRAIAPIVETFAIDYADRLTVATVDVDENPDLARRYAVRSVPTIMLVDGGDVQQIFVGVRPPHEYREGIEALIH